MENLILNKKTLLNKILLTNAFWSLDKSSITVENISDNLLIENTFIHGDIKEIQLLFQIYKKEKLQNVWSEKLVPDNRYSKLNYYLGTCFFKIENTKDYIQKAKIKNSRYKKLKQLTRKHEASIS